MWPDVTVEAVTVQDHAVETIGTPNLRKGPWGFRLQGLPAGPAGGVTVRLVVNFNDHFLSQLIKVGVWLLVPSCASATYGRVIHLPGLGLVRPSNAPPSVLIRLEVAGGLRFACSFQLKLKSAGFLSP